jgi:hypothetical protein
MIFSSKDNKRPLESFTSQPTLQYTDVLNEYYFVEKGG